MTNLSLEMILKLIDLLFNNKINKNSRMDWNLNFIEEKKNKDILKNLEIF